MQSDRPQAPIPRIATLFVGFCAILSLASLLVWPASYRSTPSCTLQGPDSRFDLQVMDGRIIFGVFQNEGQMPWWWRPRRSGLADLIRYPDRFITADALGWGIAVPCWLIALVAALPGAWWFFVLRANREQRLRRAYGLCRHCGYDLRGHRSLSNTSVICPECGQPVDAMLENALLNAPA